MKPSFSASLMCMNYLYVKDQIEILNDYVDFYHIDIIDGHYSKNLSLSPDLMKAFKKVAKKPMDVHLATIHSEDWIEVCAKAGAKYITVHVESINKNAFRILNMIRDVNCKVGIAINPATPLQFAEHLLEKADLLTIMTVDAGFPGQQFIPEMLEKIALAKKIREEKGYTYKIQVDGSVNKKTFRQLKEAGADIYILGSSGLFGLDEDIHLACEKAYENFERATR